MTPAIGAEIARYALEDHQHPRLTSATSVTLDANGVGTVMFSRTFPTEPVTTFMAIMPTNGPIICEIQSWVRSGSDYTGAVVKGYRVGTQTLASVQVLGIAVGVGGQTVNVVSNASGAKVSIIALVPSA